MSRKIFVALIFILAAFVGGNLVTKNICSASMPYSEMSLGGITYESTYSDLIRTYGRPTYQNPGVEHEAECHYGNDVKIFYNSFQNKINTVIVTANNGWATPRGLTVGMNISTRWIYTAVRSTANPARSKRRTATSIKLLTGRTTGR